MCIDSPALSPAEVFPRRHHDLPDAMDKRQRSQHRLRRDVAKEGAMEEDSACKKCWRLSMAREFYTLAKAAVGPTVQRSNYAEDLHLKNPSKYTAQADDDEEALAATGSGSCTV